MIANMMTFDDILPTIEEVLAAHADDLENVEWLIINRDVYGKVRLIAPEPVQHEATARGGLERLAESMAEQLGQHAYPQDSCLLFESSFGTACFGSNGFLLRGFENVWLIDRLAVECDWAQIAPETQGPRRIVFYASRDNPCRSASLIETAKDLSRDGKCVLVIDLDLESPGLSSSMLPPDRQSDYGITDWLVEDLVDNADVVFDGMVSTSGLSVHGAIHVVPAHGANPGEYVAKLGRVLMPKIRSDGTREPWSSRLHRLLCDLEWCMRPDVVLIYSGTGIGEVASVCVTDLGANMVFWFGHECGYRILFEHWQLAGVAATMRERLHLVDGGFDGSMIYALEKTGALADNYESKP